MPNPIATQRKRVLQVLASKKGCCASLASGEGLMIRFKGPGLLIVQSHQPPRLGPNGRLQGAGARQTNSAAAPIIVLIFSLFMFAFLALLFFVILRAD